MNIKGLLLGSAAAFAAVSGAQAADAIVAAAPEPMEYVKVCDAFGTGYFYIPGTETCLKFNGMVRYEVHYRNTAGASSTWQAARARLETSAKSDSEFGTVSSWFRIQADSSTLNTSNPAYSGQFKLGIGGLEAGYADPKWDGIGGGFTDWGGNHEGVVDPSTFVSYSATFGAVSGWIEVTSPNASVAGVARKPGIDGALSAKMDNFSGLIAVGYDFQAKATAVEGYVTGSFDPFKVKLEGLYSSSAANSYFAYKGFSLIAGVSAAVTSNVTLAGDFQWFDNKAWKVGGDVVWNVAPGFAALAEVTYAKGTVAGIQTDRTTDLFLRLQRTF